LLSTNAFYDPIGTPSALGGVNVNHKPRIQEKKRWLR
jgi:hypothetical protein